MTRDEGIAYIKRQLSFRTTLDSEIADEMLLAQTMLEDGPTKPWFLLSERSIVQVTVDDERIPVPSDFLQEYDSEGLCYVPDPDDQITYPRRPLQKMGYDELQINYDSIPADAEEAAANPLERIPLAYALAGDYFRIRHIPDDQYYISMIYYKKDTTLETNVENGWLKHVPYLLLGTAGLQISEGPIRDMTATKVFQQWIQVGAAVLYKRNEAREHANQDYQMGGRHW